MYGLVTFRGDVCSVWSLSGVMYVRFGHFQELCMFGLVTFRSDVVSVWSLSGVMYVRFGHSQG